MTQKKKSGNIIAIIAMIFLFGMISFVTNLASPMGDVLKYQFGVANWMGTLGVFANFIAYAVMGYPAGKMLQNLRDPQPGSPVFHNPFNFSFRRLLDRERQHHIFHNDHI